MRQAWFDHLEEIITTVRRSAQLFWSHEEIEQLFGVHTESARNLLIAIGRAKVDGRNYITEARTLLAFLEEFATLLYPAATPKWNHREAIRAAQTLLREKLKNESVALKEAATSRKADGVLQSGLGFEINEALHVCLLQAQASFGKNWQEIVVEIISNQCKKQESSTLKLTRSKARKGLEFPKYPQSFMDFGKNSSEESS